MKKLNEIYIDGCLLLSVPKRFKFTNHNSNINTMIVEIVKMYLLERKIKNLMIKK